jgi:hypothetical protein
VLDGDFDHGAEVVVVLAADGAVAGVDAVLGEGLGAVGVFGEEKVAVVVEVADDGRGPALGVDAFDDVGNGLGGVVVVDGDADHLGAGAGEGGDLLDGGLDVGGVGVGHRLDDDGSVGADADVADGDGFRRISPTAAVAVGLIQAVFGVVVVVDHPLLENFGGAGGLAVTAHVDELFDIDLQHAGFRGV